MPNKTKLIYILPEYNNTLDGHIYYLVNFLQEVGKVLDIFLIIEKSLEKEPPIKNMRGVYVQYFSYPILRFIEVLVIVLWKRMQGYKKTYVHYSYIGGITSSVIMRLSSGTTYYWSCGMMWLFGKQPLLSITLKFVNHLVTGAHALKKGYQENYGISEDKILIMPNWIELARLENISVNKKELRGSLGFHEKDRIILFVHRLAKRKGIHYISEIAKKLIHERNIKFLIIGDGPYKNTLLEEKKNGNLDNIHYIGRVPNKEIYQYFLMSDIFLMPSEEEGFPRVLLESMACNIPYVASDIGGVREISPDWQQEYIYPIGNVDGFVSGILKLSGKKYDYSEHIRQYDIEKVVNIFISLIGK